MLRDGAAAPAHPFQEARLIFGWIDPSTQRWGPRRGDSDDGVSGRLVVVILLVCLAAVYFVLAALM